MSLEAGYDSGYAQSMKTAISIPDEVLGASDGHCGCAHLEPARGRGPGKRPVSPQRHQATEGCGSQCFPQFITVGKSLLTGRVAVLPTGMFRQVEDGLRLVLSRRLARDLLHFRYPFVLEDRE